MRRSAAVFACLLWLLGVEVLPNLHLAHHDDTPHTHAANGMVITVSFERAGAEGMHRHADGSIHEDHAAPASASAKRGRAPIDTSITAPLDNHAASGLAHRALALLDPPPPDVSVDRVDRVATDLVIEPAGRPSVVASTTADARGPPNA